MSNKLTFYTPTTLDEAFIFTMGASVKKTNNPIGFFGTGLKYAIAVTLRLGGRIKIMTNEKLFKFYSRVEKLRDEDMNMVYCDIHYSDGRISTAVRCPMTTDYGKTWEPWMVMRELYSNTMDENGQIWSETEKGEATLNQEYTLITVEHPAIYDAWLTRDKYIINAARTPLWKDDAVEIYQGAASALFYRGINVCQPVMAAFTYNLTAMVGALREDRTYEETNIRSMVLNRLVKCKDRHILSTFFRAACIPETFESRFHFAHYDLWEVTDEYADEAIKGMKEGIATAPASLKMIAFKYMREREKEGFYKQSSLTKDQEERHNICAGLLEKLGYRLSDYKIYYTYDMPDEQHGAAFPATSTIVLNIKTTLEHTNWQKQTCVTLIEEVQHLKYNAPDFTQMMQDGYNESIYQIALTGKIA